MVTVDSKGSNHHPTEIRKRLAITPGTEVEIHEHGGKAIHEPEANPEEVIERIDQLVEATSPEQRETTPPEEVADPSARKHCEAVRRGAEKTDNG